VLLDVRNFFVRDESLAVAAQFSCEASIYPDASIKTLILLINLLTVTIP
jgi:hypothetical protein